MIILIMQRIICMVGIGAGGNSAQAWLDRPFNSATVAGRTSVAVPTAAGAIHTSEAVPLEAIP